MKMLADLQVKLTLVGQSHCPAECLTKNSIHPTKAEIKCFHNCIHREEQLKKVILDNFKPFDQRDI